MERLRLTRPAADILTAPDKLAPLDDQILFGQSFDVISREGDFLYGRPIDGAGNSEGNRAGNAGYIHHADIDPLCGSDAPPSHRISTLCAPLFSKADIKSPVLMTLSLGSLLGATGQDGEFHATELGYIHNKHLASLDQPASDWVETAMLYLGLPYYWGGRSRDGVDCSGLVQNALWSAGIECPRNSGEQAQSLGEALDILGGLPLLMRGDLVFWRGHVGIMTDATHMLHANAYHMKTAIEPLSGAIDRIELSAGPVTTIRRLAKLRA